MNGRELCDLGYYVIPIEPRGKKPIAGQGADHCSNDPALIAEWEERFPGCNWGVVCENIIVFDLDTKQDGVSLSEDETVKAWGWLCDRYNIPGTPVVTTGTNGRHYYYKRPSAKIKGSTRVKFNIDGKEYKTNIDIRVGKQYVVAPGSVHPNGNRYICEDFLPYEYLPELPQEFVDALPQAEKPADKIQLPISVSSTDTVERCRRYVDRCPNAVEGQGGDNQLLQIANVIFWGFGLSKNQGWDIFQDYNVRKCIPPFDESVLEHKFRQATGESHINKPFGYLNEQEDFSAVEKSIRNIEQQNKDNEKKPLLKLINGEDIELKPEKWLWEDRILLGSLTVVFGIGAVGKSSLILEWAARVTSGTDWADGTPNDEGTVLFFSSEETEDSAKAKIVFWGGKAKNFYYVKGCYNSTGGIEVFDMDNATQLDDTIAFINNNPAMPNVRMIILDPIASVLGDANENSNKEVRNMLERLNPILAKHEIACIGIAHSRKPTLDSGTLSRNRLAGSIAFANLPRTVWEIIKEDSGICTMLTAKSNLTETPKGLSYRFDKAERRAEINGRKLSHLIYVDPEIDTTMDVYLTGKKESKPRKVTKREVAAEWLEQLLSPNPDGLPLGYSKREPGTILYQAELAGYNYAIINKAVTTGLVKIVETKQGTNTTWRLADKEAWECFASDAGDDF